MSDINRISVLKAFIEHGKIIWQGFASNNIFERYDGGTPRANLLGDILTELEDDQLLERLKVVPGPAWKLIDFNKAVIELGKADPKENYFFVKGVALKILKYLINHQDTRCPNTYGPCIIKLDPGTSSIALLKIY